MNILVKIFQPNDFELLNYLKIMKRNKLGTILIVGPKRSGKTELLNQLNDLYIKSNQILNLGIELSKIFLNVEKYEDINIKEEIQKIILNYSFFIFIDNIEVMLDSYIQLDPINTLLYFVKDLFSVISVPGMIRGNDLDFGPGTRKYDIKYNIKYLKENDIIINLGGN